MNKIKKHWSKPSTIVKFLILIVSLTIHEHINPYDGFNRSRFDVLFWLKEFSVDSVAVGIFFVICGVISFDYYKMFILPWIQSIVFVVKKMISAKYGDNK